MFISTLSTAMLLAPLPPSSPDQLRSDLPSESFVEHSSPGVGGELTSLSLPRRDTCHIAGSALFTDSSTGRKDIGAPLLCKMQTMPQNLATLPDHGHPHMLLTVPMTQTPALIGLRGVLSKPSFSRCRMRVGALGDLKGLFQMLPCESLKGNFFRTASSQAVVFSALCTEWAPCLMTAHLQRTLC